MAAAWLALIGVYAYVAFERIHELVPAAMIGVLGGTFAAMLLSSFIGLFTGGRDRGAIRNSGKTFGIALAFFAGLHALLLPMYWFAPGGRSEAAAAVSVWDERDCDRQKVSLGAGANPNERGTDAMTPLINAARLGEPACVRQLIAAGARVEDTDNTGDTTLYHAVRAGRDENVRILLEAGAKDFRVTAATGRRITEGAAPLDAVREYVEALYRGDFHAMAGLMENASEQLMEERRADLPLWQSRQPKTFTIDDGWMTDDAATLTIRGATPSGDRRVAFHLKRRPDGWMIQKEWFPDER